MLSKSYINLFKIDDLCSGYTSIISLIKMIVSSDAMLPFFSNIKNESINGSIIYGIVFGYSWVILLTLLISKYLYSLVLDPLPLLIGTVTVVSFSFTSFS